MVELEKKLQQLNKKQYYVSIPKKLFDAKVLDLETIYKITIEEAISDGST